MSKDTVEAQAQWKKQERIVAASLLARGETKNLEKVNYSKSTVI